MEGTALLVSELKPGDAKYDEYVAASAAKVGTKAENIELSRVFNIQIVDENDHSTVYEPVGDVEVSIRLVGETLNNYANLDVLHFVEDENTEGFTVYDMDSIVDGETVQFTTDSFSVYVVTGYVLETTIDIEGQTYKVTATYDDNAGIPGDAKLSVSEMSTEDEDYLTYLNNTAAALGVSAGELGYLRMFDISIVGNDGTEYKPNDQVTVTVELMDETETGNLRVVHFGDKTQELNATTEGDIVTFTTDSFSLFSFVDLTLIQNVVDAVFGSTYTDQIYENDDIIVSGRMPRTAIVEVNPAEVEIEGQDVLVAYDIKIYAGLITKALGIAWQPTDGALTVQMKSDALDVEAADVYHMADASSTAELVAEAVLVKENTIIFEADAFSVYVVIDHEGNTTVTTPRVQFHFISQDYTGTANPYSASPFNFYNKADPAELQCSQILTKNESLEMIANPPNIIVYTHTTDTAIDAAKTYYTYASGTYSAVDNPDVGDIGTYYEATGEKFFYGWYVVNKVEDLTTYNGSAWTGTIQYNWPANPDKISFEKPMSLTDADGNALTSATVLTAGSTELKWTIDGVTYSGTLDNEGIIHVYLAPIYEDYYFINFRMGALDDSENALHHSLMTRRLVVFGSSDSTSVRIGDIICPSSDPTHLVFIGWQTQAMHDDNDQYYPTVDATGNEQNSSGSTSGYYITLSNTDFSGTVYDLYPLFAEARWLNFNTGKSGIGATYVGSTYRLTNDQTRGTYYENSFFSANTSIRNGYDLAGWYAFANMNANSEITNLTTAEDVEVSYLDSNSQVQTVTFNMKALELVHHDLTTDTYSLVVPANGTIATTSAGGHTYTLSASSGLVSLTIDGTAYPIFGVLTESGEPHLYFYRAMDDLTVAANWVKYDQTTYKVIVWKQKVTDDKNATQAQKTYDYEIFYTSNRVSSSTTLNASSFSGTYVDSSNQTRTAPTNLMTLGFTGFHYARNDMDGKTPAPDGTSVYNVYYDRDLLTMNFYLYGRTSWAHTTADTPTTQYGLIDGEYVELTRDSGTQVTVWTPQYTYTSTTADGTDLYGLINGEYVGPLTRVSHTETAYRWQYTYYSGWYMDTRSNDGIFYIWDGGTGNYTSTTQVASQYTRDNPPPESDTTTYCCIDNYYTYYFKLQRVSNGTTTTYTYTYNGEAYTDTRYIRASGGSNYIGTRYTKSGTTYTATTGEDGTQYGVDENGGHVQLTKGTQTVYKWYAPVYDYVPHINNTSGEYGLVDGEYVKLTKNVGSYSYNRTGYTYTRNTNDNGNDPAKYGVVDGAIQQVYRRNGAWRLTDDRNGTQYSGYNYTRSNSNSNAYTGQLYTLISGTAGNNQSGFQTTTAVSGNNLFGRDGNNNTYFQLSVTENNITYTYVDSNGVTQTYSGDRYDLIYENTGRTVEYTGERYVSTSYGSNAWRIYKSFTGLYGQTLGDNDYLWPDEYDWYTGYNGSTAGGNGTTHTTFLDTFLATESFYGKSPDTGTYSIRHYKQNLDGTWSEPPANETPSDGSGTFNFTKKYDGFTMPTWYYTGSGTPNFTNVSTAGGWTQRGSETSVSQNGSLYILYSRESETFTFDVNYPEGATVTYNGLTVAQGATRSTNKTETLLYEAPLNSYGYTKAMVNNEEITTWYYGVDDDTNDYSTYELIAPDHYSFGGWYEDATGTVPFNFNSTMPAANKIVYAKWEKDWFVMHIDPNGAEIDHVDHAGGGFIRPAIPGERQADSGYDPSQSTYFWLSYGSLISEYDVSRNYVPISDAAASQYTGTIYYYMNHQYAYDQDGEWGFDAKVRNALYLTERELHDYYLYYKSFTGSAALDEDIWQQYYTSYGKQKYRVTNNQEHYVFLGWYQVFDAGEATEHLGDMPYVFSTPISGDVYLRAMWRLDGGYTIQYHADYTMDDGTWINGDMEAWIDPKVGDIPLSYADGAHTNVYKQPTNIRTPQGPTDEYIFRGFRLVSVREDSHENLIYKPMETDDQGNVSRYYDPGDVFTIRAANADTNSIIHLQAVYEEIDSSYRRPYITNLTLDANGGYLVNADGSTMMHNTDLTASSGWDEIGTVAATVKDPTTGASLDPDAIIEVGDIQSNVALHLYRYATKLTHAGGNPSGTVLDPAGTNYFAHPRNYFLLGFDEGKTEGDYIATYGADAIISIDRNQAQTIYAVWEPMIYLNFKNETESTIHFGLSSTNALTMYILNEVTGLYDREKISDPSNISLTPNATIHLALPYGEEQSITVSGTNELGVGKILTWDTSVTDDSSGITYCTRTQGTGGIYTHKDVTYTHQRVVDWNTNQTENCAHVLAHGQRDSSGDGAFSFDETLLINSKGLTVIFDEDNIAYALVLNDNYNGDGTGGGTQEYDYTNDYLNYTPHHSQLLPTRVV